MKFKAMLVKIFNVLGVDVKDMDVCEDKILFDYGMFSVDLNSESNGTRKLFEILCLFLDGMLNDKVLIWFTELDKSERKTELYSTYDFKNVRNTDNICKNYIEGRYGAVPDIIK